MMVIEGGKRRGGKNRLKQKSSKAHKILRDRLEYIDLLTTEQKERQKQ